MSLISRKKAPTKKRIPTQDKVSGLRLKVISTTGFQRTDLPNLDDDYSAERDRAINKMADDGLRPLTKEETKKEHKMTKALLKKFTANILQCDYSALSFPISFSEPRSYLERTADLFAFLVHSYIKKASDENEPSMKLAYITTGIIAGYHLDLNLKKVFNPILGESFVGKWENGATIYGEQISHHPPLSCWQIYGPNEEWYCYSDQIKFSVDNGLSQLECAMNGLFHLKLKDGTTYEWEFPVVQLSGQIKGPRIIKIDSKITVKDITNGFTAVVDVEPKTLKVKPDTRASTIFGGIKKEEKNKIKISLKEDYVKTFAGDYATKITVDGVEVWNINNDIARRPIGQVQDDELLPSDVRFRLDRGLLILDKIEDADKAKTALEEIQRREEKMRVCVKKNSKLLI